MSFDVNPLNDYTPPSIKTTKTTDGGAGNLGYFEQEKRKEKEHEEELEKSIFKESKDTYSFSVKAAEDSYYGDVPPLLKIVNAVKSFINKLLNK